MKFTAGKNSLFAALAALLFFAFAINDAAAQSYVQDMKRQSARSDKLTGGAIERAALVPGGGNLKITVNVPSFQMTLWQNGKEVKTYPIGVGLKDYPIYIGSRRASAIIWNPVWIPPDSDWVHASKTVKAGEIILPTDARNPLGKVKIPLGDGYLIHQAKGATDLGNLVSHGCVRVMQADLYDLTEKIVAARTLEVAPEQIAEAKRTKKTLISELEPVVPVEITYDTIIVEAGKLHIYPDIYERKVNTIENLRAELKWNDIGTADLDEATLQKMLARAAVPQKKFVVSVKNIEAGKALIGGQTAAVIAPPSNTKPAVTQKRRTSR